MVSPTRRSLYRLDKLTGQATVIGAEGRLGVRIADIAVRGDEAFGIGIAGDEGLYRIDTANGTASLVGRFASDIVLANAGMDFDSAGNLWGVGHIVDGQGQPQPSRILRIDRAAGTATAGPTTRTGVKGLAITPTRCDVSGTPPPAPPVGSRSRPGRPCCCWSWRCSPPACAAARPDPGPDRTAHRARPAPAFARRPVPAVAR